MASNVGSDHTRTSPSQTGPLSFAEERMWWLQQLDPDTTAYNVKLALRFRRPLDRDAIADALNRLISRHDSLRTLYIQDEAGEPRRLVLDQFNIELDWRQLEDDRAWTAVADEALKTPFDLARSIPIRAMVITCSRMYDVLVLVIHHIAADNWSLRLLQRDLAVLYEAAQGSGEGSLPPIIVNYSSIACAQRTVERDEINAQISYWQAELDGFEPLSLPHGHYGGGGESSSGPECREANFELSEELTMRLKSFALRERCAFPSAIVAIFQALLARISGQEDIVIGSALEGRERGEWFNTVGFFVSTVALRAQISDGISFRDLLRAVNMKMMRAAENRNAPFDKVVAAVRPTRDSGRNAIFSSGLIHHREHSNLPDSGEYQAFVREEWPNSRSTTLDLELHTMVHDSRLVGTLVYRKDAVDDVMARQYVACLPRLFDEVLRAPDEAIVSLDILSSAERVSTLDRWNGVDAPLERVTATALIDRQVRRGPDAVAAICGNTRLTYGQLDSRAEALADVLKARGVARGDIVALVLPRSVDMIVAVISVLKCGAAYLPLDPKLPNMRLRQLIDDSGAKCVCASVATVESVADIRGTLMLENPALTGECRGQSAAQVMVPTANVTRRADDAAYVIYTSGSTGVPKGVVVGHAGLVNLAAWLRASFGEHVFDRVLAASSFSFDMSVLEMLVPLLGGGCIEIVSDFLALSELPASRFSMVCGVPSAMEAVLKSGVNWSADLVIVGGERCTRALTDLIRASIPGATLLNGYGPTEATCFATAWVYADGQQLGNLPIGRPIDNMRAYILDRLLMPAPVGVVGELYLAGVGLAHGYLSQPALTAERFVPNPYGHPSERMYRTGDLAYWRPEGVMVYAGRSDDQVKLRGHRVELGEIEAVLTRHPEVAQAAVAVRTSGNAERLVAYVALRDPERRDVQDLDKFLGDYLPKYMIPTAFAFMGELPLLPSGKLNRRALPEWTPSAAVPRAPLTDAEETIASIFAEVLGIDGVVPGADFFELGGHSLLATRVVSRVRSTLRRRITLRDIFEYRTATALACAAANAKMLLPELRPTAGTGEEPLSYGQARLWFLQQATESSPTYNIPIAIRLTGELDYGALEYGFRCLLSRHNVLRTTYPMRDGVPCPSVVEASVAFAGLEVLDMEEDELARELERRALLPFDITQETPLRAWIFRLSSSVHVMLVSVHHIAADGWSVGPLLQNLSDAYKSRRSGQEWRPEPLAIQYSDYSAWQREILGSASDEHSVVAVQSQYWKQQLSGAAAELAMTHSRRRLVNGSPAAKVRRVDLSGELHSKLGGLGRQAGASLSMVLHAAVAVLLSKYGCGTDLVIGGVTSGRVDPLLDEMIGFFANTLALRYEWSERSSFMELVDIVRIVDLAAYANQDLPFDVVVDLLNPPRQVSRNPLFQVMVLLQDGQKHDGSLFDVSASSETVEAAAPKFDLSFTFREKSSSLGAAAGISGRLEYRADLFDSAEMEVMSERLVNLVIALVSAPEVPLARIGLIPEVRQSEVDQRGKLPEGGPATLLAGVGGALTPGRMRREVEALSRTFAKILGLPAVSETDNFFRLGGNSLQAVRLAAEASVALGAQVKVADVFRDPTVIGILETYLNSDNREPSVLEVVLPIRRGTGEPPFFMFHPALGLGWCYLPLSHGLGGRYPIYGLQARGIVDIETMAADMHGMVDDYVGQIVEVQNSGPFRLFGWSFGGLLAHAAAVRLQDRGEEVSMLAMLESYPDMEGSSARNHLLEDPEIVTARSLGKVMDVQRALPDAAWVLPEQYAANLNRVRVNNIELGATYRPRLFDGSAVFLAAEDSLAGGADPSVWKSYVSGGLHVEVVPGSHYGIFETRTLNELVRVLDHALDGAG